MRITSRTKSVSAMNLPWWSAPGRAPTTSHQVFSSEDRIHHQRRVAASLEEGHQLHRIGGDRLVGDLADQIGVALALGHGLELGSHRLLEDARHPDHAFEAAVTRDEFGAGQIVFAHAHHALGLQTEGVMGVGKFYLTSPKFISGDGGFKRVVWMSSILKQTMAAELQTVAEREGDPDLIRKIADETVCTDPMELVAFLEGSGHPALMMDPIF